MTTRRTFTAEFKRDACALVTDQKFSQNEAAQRLDITPAMISRWLKDANETESELVVSDVGSAEIDSKATIRALRSQLKAAEMREDILKKAFAISLSRVPRDMSSLLTIDRSGL